MSTANIEDFATGDNENYHDQSGAKTTVFSI